MASNTQTKYLRFFLVLFGIIFLFGLYPLMNFFWPAGWRWIPNQSDYEQMMVGVYATLGVFLLLASRDPVQHLSLIWFTVCSSAVHGGIMLVQAFQQPEEHGHLTGDVPALLLAAAVLAVLTPKRLTAGT